MAEILNNALCGARSVHGALRWLSPGDCLEAATARDHQLLYLMEGDATITLKGADYPVQRGAGLYLAPGESARIRQSGSAALKLLHLTVPIATSGR